ncbi:MAG: hypothetical protein ACYDCI_06680 [Candidatus Limnocylindrales bacterium]
MPDEAVREREIIGFVRFCHDRRRVGWPELYDEMCAVASRRLYNGWGIAELADRGIGFSLFETPILAAVAREVIREEADRRPILGRARRGFVRVEAEPDVATG